MKQLMHKNKKIAVVAFVLLATIGSYMPALSQMKIFIQYQDQFGAWKSYTTKHNERDAYRTMKFRGDASGKRMRMVDDNGNLLDLYNP